VALEVAGKLGLAGQVHAMPGDLQVVGFGEEQCDVVWFGNITHYYGPQDVVALLRKAWRALAPDGAVVVNAPIADEARCEREMALLGSLVMYVRSSEGDVYRGAEYRYLLAQAGFVDVVEASDMLIIGTKM
jgi:SAM-dependent methyltransferase